MIEYKIDYVVENGIKESMIFVFSKEHPVLGLFLWSEESHINEFLDTINDVLSGKELEVECTGNACGIFVQKDQTTIENFMTDEGVKKETVRTADLAALIKEFIAKQREFKEKQNKGLL